MGPHGRFDPWQLRSTSRVWSEAEARISVPRESVWPVLGHALRWGVEAGSITYSAVIQPPGRVGGNHGGRSCVTEAVHQTTVPPCCHRTDPAAASVKRRVIFTGRS